MPDFTISLTDDEVDCIKSVSGHDPETFIKLRVGDCVGQAKSKDAAAVAAALDTADDATKAEIKAKLGIK